MDQAALQVGFANTVMNLVFIMAIMLLCIDCFVFLVVLCTGSRCTDTGCICHHCLLSLLGIIYPGHLSSRNRLILVPAWLLCLVVCLKLQAWTCLETA